MVFSFKKLDYLENPLFILQPKNEILEDISNSIVEFLREYFNKNSFSKAVVGLSGGLDSTVVAHLCVQALGKENVYGVILPSEFTSEDHIRKALKVCDLLSISCNNYKNIISLFQKTASLFVEMGEISDDSNIQKIKYGNIQARIRMIILRDIARKHGALVVGTTNKTERLLGYSTVGGDGLGGVDIEPLFDLYKTTEKYLAEYIGVPSDIINQKPTAELWENHFDEDELGLEYVLIDQILLGLNYNVSKEDIIKVLLDYGITFKNIEFLVERLNFSAFKGAVASHCKCYV